MLSADTSHWEADRVVKAFYRDAADSAVITHWASRLGVSPQADSLLAFLRREAPANGLDTLAFFVPQIAADLQTVRDLAFDSVGVSINEVLPRLDYRLTCAYVRYAAGMKRGFVRPARMLNRLTDKPLFDYAVESPDYHEPLRKLLADSLWPCLHEVEPTYTVYQQLKQRLAAAADTTERRRLALNMERARWAMKRPASGEKHILVNLPSLHLWAVDGDSVLDMRICCGSTATKTPLLASAISHLELNPDWIIPTSIVQNEVARHGGDSAYFARHHYYIVERQTGDTLAPRGVSTEQLLSGRYRVGQYGGPGNSLGRIVFRFPNDFAVYLHDTNNRGAFQQERRTLSHGCIRVQKPFELAQFLLPEADEWTLDRIRISMDIKPEGDEGRDWLKEHAEEPRPHRLISWHGVNPRVGLYITYFTAYPNPATGTVETYSDIYGYDRVLLDEIKPFVR